MVRSTRISGRSYRELHSGLPFPVLVSAPWSLRCGSERLCPIQNVAPRDSEAQWSCWSHQSQYCCSRCPPSRLWKGIADNGAIDSVFSQILTLGAGLSFFDSSVVAQVTLSPRSLPTPPIATASEQKEVFASERPAVCRLPIAFRRPAEDVFIASPWRGPLCPRPH